MATQVDKAAEGVKSADRVLSILEIFQELREPISAKALANALSMPRSSTNVLLRSMIGAGYLRYDEEETTYYPTIKLFYLGSWLMEGHFNDPAMTKLLNAMASDTQETVCLWIRLDFDMVAVDVIDGVQAIALHVKTGSRAAVFGSVVGTAWLAAMPDEDVNRLIDRYNKARNENLSKSAIFHEIETARKDGIGEGYDRWLKDAGAIAKALKPKDYAEPVVIGVGGPDYRIRRNALAIKHSFVQQLG